jgi:hypothetical protein
MTQLRWYLLAIATVSMGALAAAAQEAAAADAAGKAGRDRAPRVLTFYYPWYGNPDAEGGSGRWSHWEGVDVSWWGHGAFSDGAMPAILDQCRKAGIDVTIYYETVPGRKTPESASRDILRLLGKYAGHPAWLRVGGKPVVFIYGRAVDQLGLDGWQKAIAQVNEKYKGGAVFFGDSFSPRAAEVFDGLHTYNTAGALRGKSAEETAAWAKDIYPKWVETARKAGRISTITVIPGYDDTKIRKPGLRVERHGGDLYRRQWEAAIAARPDWVLVTSWNEWHEGSEIEPSVEYGKQYLELTAEYAARFKAKR